MHLIKPKSKALSKPKALKLAGDPAEVPGAPAEATVELSIKHNVLCGVADP